MTRLINLQTYSDLNIHFEGHIPSIRPCSEFLFLAGNIGVYQSAQYLEFLQFISLNWKHIIYVLGEVEFEASELNYSDTVKLYRDLVAEYPNIHILDNCEDPEELPCVLIDDFVIYGCPGWEFNLNSSDEHHVNLDTLPDLVRVEIETLQTIPTVQKSFDFLSSGDIILTRIPPLEVYNGYPIPYRCIVRCVQQRNFTIPWFYGCTRDNTAIKINQFDFCTNQSNDIVGVGQKILRSGYRHAGMFRLRTRPSYGCGSIQIDTVTLGFDRSNPSAQLCSSQRGRERGRGSGRGQERGRGSSWPAAPVIQTEIPMIQTEIPMIRTEIPADGPLPLCPKPSAKIIVAKPITVLEMMQTTLLTPEQIVKSADYNTDGSLESSASSRTVSPEFAMSLPETAQADAVQADAVPIQTGIPFGSGLAMFEAFLASRSPNGAK